jgi:hypothetical protein
MANAFRRIPHVQKDTAEAQERLTEPPPVARRGPPDADSALFSGQQSGNAWSMAKWLLLPDSGPVSLLDRMAV